MRVESFRLRTCFGRSGSCQRSLGFGSPGSSHHHKIVAGRRTRLDCRQIAFAHACLTSNQTGIASRFDLCSEWATLSTAAVVCQRTQNVVTMHGSVLGARESSSRTNQTSRSGLSVRWQTRLHRPAPLAGHARTLFATFKCEFVASPATREGDAPAKRALS